MPISCLSKGTGTEEEATQGKRLKSRSHLEVTCPGDGGSTGSCLSDLLHKEGAEIRSERAHESFKTAEIRPLRRHESPPTHVCMYVCMGVWMCCTGIPSISTMNKSNQLFFLVWKMLKSTCLTSSSTRVKTQK